MKKNLIKLLSLCLCLGLVFAGCGTSEEEVSKEVSEEVSESAPESAPESEEATESQQSEEENSEETEAETLVYIGFANGGYKSYPVELTGEKTPAKLIEAMGTLTGWNMSLASDAVVADGAVTVSFSPESALLMGPPEPQKDEFHVFDVNSLVETILDSVAETLRQNFAEDGKLDVYYNLAGEVLDLPNAGWTIPMDKPYTGIANL